MGSEGRKPGGLRNMDEEVGGGRAHPMGLRRRPSRYWFISSARKAFFRR
jgi:hypothetical protein